MLPKIFISSTIEDLSYLRDTIRDSIKDMAYKPVMSEYGEVPYLPHQSVVESCYSTISECQLAIIIVGKRYGNVDRNKAISVTHNEFRTARNNELPVIFLINKEVLAFKRVYDQNEDSNVSFPGMDNPVKTFELINEFSNYHKNNGYIPFENVSEVRSRLKEQLASIFGYLLTKNYDPMRVEVKDILSEIKTLRHELLRNNDYKTFLKIMRVFLDDEYSQFKNLIIEISGNIEDSIAKIIEATTFENFVSMINSKLIIQTNEEIEDYIRREKRGFFGSSFFFINEKLEKQTGWFIIKNDKKVYLTKEGKNYFEIQFDKLNKIKEQAIEE